MTSYQALINEITTFYDNHIQVKKVGSDFKEQMFNFATKDEKYPIVYIVPERRWPPKTRTTLS